MLLSELSNGTRAWVEGVVPTSLQLGAMSLHRLTELGFIRGEPVQMLRRGPGGREPLAVQVGETQFALRLLEAQCIEVRPIGAASVSDTCPPDVPHPKFQLHPRG